MIPDFNLAGKKETKVVATEYMTCIGTRDLWSRAFVQLAEDDYDNGSDSDAEDNVDFELL